MCDVNPINIPRTLQCANNIVAPAIVKSVVASDGTRIDLRSETLDDDDLILITETARGVRTMSTVGTYPIAWLDTTWFGNASQFTYRVPFELRGHLTVGDLVWVADDSVDPYLCRIAELLDNGRSARYEVVE